MTVRPSPIREALNHRYGVGNGHMWRDALAELDALEAVADAARTALAQTLVRPVGWEILDAALARLVAVQDGQTPAPEAGRDPDEANRPTSGASPEGNDGGPGAGVCPCKSHGDPDGDCGED